MSDNQNNGGIVIQKKHIIIAGILILLLIIGGIIIGAKWFGSSQTETVQSELSAETAPDAPVPALDIDPNAGNWNGQLPQDKSDEAVGIKIPGYPSITIQKDTQQVVMALLNPEGNPCYFKFQIVLKDSGETIYESQYVPPGQSITDVTLTRPLSEGEYDATIMITTIALDQVTPLNGANVETVLIAK